MRWYDSLAGRQAARLASIGGGRLSVLFGGGEEGGRRRTSIDISPDVGVKASCMPNLDIGLPKMEFQGVACGLDKPRRIICTRFGT